MADLFNTDYLQHLCRLYGMRPSKKYGQNFLINPEVLEEMLEAATVDKEDTVVEVGPGFGILSFRLAENAERVLSFEIEKKLLPYWEKHAGQKPNLNIIWGNALKEFPKQAPDLKKYKVVANVPYQITSPLLRMFLEAETPPEVMVVMVQKEVAERICAKPGDLTVLGLAMQYFSSPEIVFLVPRASFWPEPKVDSAVIRLTPHPRALPKAQETRLFDLIHSGFSSKRKLLIKNLRGALGAEAMPALVEAFSVLSIPPKARAQELTLAQWMGLVKILAK